MILDATAGDASGMWPKEADIRIDVRPTRFAGMIADDRELPFRDLSFDLIYCDPPHLVGYDPGVKSIWSKDFLHRFGWWDTRSDWLKYLYKVNLEFYRVLKDDGTLYLKLFDGYSSSAIYLREAEMALTRWEIVKDRRHPPASVFSRSESTYWTARKILDGRSVSPLPKVLIPGPPLREVGNAT